MQNVQQAKSEIRKIIENNNNSLITSSVRLIEGHSLNLVPNY
jgi:hypothetical protein